ncbi:MAG: YgjP-like metallopeptidase domain-containing protein [Eisenbergiella sp.]
MMAPPKVLDYVVVHELCHLSIWIIPGISECGI